MSHNLLPSRTSVRSDNSTSLTLIEHLKSHDQGAWQRLVALYTPLLHFWCQRWGIWGQDADDVVQEVFQAVLLGLKDFRRDREGDSFRNWLRGITRNKILDLMRRRGARGQGGTDSYKRSLLIPDPDEGNPGPDESEVIGVLFQEALNLVRGEFEERTWQTFWQTVVEGRATALVAQELGVTSGAIRQTKSRILRRLKDVLGEPIQSPKV